MFESMLHSVFETLKREHRGEGGLGFPDVWPVNPKKVTGFWTGGGDGDDGAGEVEVEGDGGVVMDGELKRGTEVEIALVGRVAKKKQTKKREVRKAKEIKEVKIAIAEKWLRGGPGAGTDGGSGGLKCAVAARGTRGAFLDARGRKKGRAGGGGGAAAVFDDGDIDVDGDGDGGVDVDVDGDVEGMESSGNGDVGAADGLEGMQNTVDDNTNKNKKPAKLSKLDDLADCLLQGVAWIQWDVNRRRILEVLNQKGEDEDLR